MFPVVLQLRSRLCCYSRITAHSHREGASGSDDESQQKRSEDAIYAEGVRSVSEEFHANV